MKVLKLFQQVRGSLFFSPRELETHIDLLPSDCKSSLLHIKPRAAFTDNLWYFLHPVPQPCLNSLHESADLCLQMMFFDGVN